MAAVWPYPSHTLHPNVRTVGKQNDVEIAAGVLDRKVFQTDIRDRGSIPPCPGGLACSPVGHVESWRKRHRTAIDRRDCHDLLLTARGQRTASLRPGISACSTIV